MGVRCRIRLPDAVRVRDVANVIGAADYYAAYKIDEQEGGGK